MRYYVETDGRIYLVRQNGTLDLPRPEQIPFAVERVAPLPADDETWFCVPRLEHHPHDWPSKDEVQGLPNVTSRVLTAVHATMPRVVVEAICLREGQILLVKGSRGLTQGRWSLPGGFLRFGETPEEGVLREVREEVGAEADLLECVGLHSKLGSFSRLHWIMLFYRIALHGAPVPNPDEIAEARFFPIEEATSLLDDSAMAEAVHRAADVA
jgi:ADP-ribose pyrophosphatase YjhB (NUDIX family)